MNNIKKIYQHAGKCDDQQNIKDIIDTAMVYTSEGVTDNNPNAPMTSEPFKKPSARKSLRSFTNILYVKSKTAKRRIVAAKSKHRAIKVGNKLWTKKKNEKGIQKSMSRSDVICIHGSHVIPKLFNNKYLMIVSSYVR